MNAKILSVFLCLLSFFLSAQTLENLKPLTQKICGANYNMDFETVADLTYPKIFENRTAFTEKLDSDYQNEVFRMRLQIENPVFKYSEILKIDGKSYCVVSYNNPIRYFFETKLDAVTGPKKAAELKQSARANETIYEPKRNSINVKRNSQLIAIADELTQNQWKFINLDDLTQRAAADSLLNESLKKQLGLPSENK